MPEGSRGGFGKYPDGLWKFYGVSGIQVAHLGFFARGVRDFLIFGVDWLGVFMLVEHGAGDNWRESLLGAIPDGA